MRTVPELSPVSDATPDLLLLFDIVTVKDADTVLEILLHTLPVILPLFVVVPEMVLDTLAQPVVLPDCDLASTVLDTLTLTLRLPVLHMVILLLPDDTLDAVPRTPELDTLDDDVRHTETERLTLQLPVELPDIEESTM